MKLPRKSLLNLLAILFFTLITALLVLKNIDEKALFYDYAEIEDTKIIRVVMDTNPINFYQEEQAKAILEKQEDPSEVNQVTHYEKFDAGFQYELLKAFAAEKGLEIKLTLEPSFAKQEEGLLKGYYDLIASNVLSTTETKKRYGMTIPIFQNQQLLVQRESTPEDSLIYLRSLIELRNKTVHLERHSPTALRVRNLSNEFADTIYIQEHRRVGTEELIQQVSEGSIDYTVCDSCLAPFYKKNFPNIDTHIAIAQTQFYGWAVRKKSTLLLAQLNEFIARYQTTTAYQTLYTKYFSDPQ